jgi:hypothetical protein
MSENANTRVRYEVEGHPIDIEGGTEGATLPNRLARRALKKQGERMLKKFGSLAHPETGERPTIVISMPKAGSPRIESRLDTDSEPLRDWLVATGKIKEERRKDAPVAEAVEAEAV